MILEFDDSEKASYLIDVNQLVTRKDINIEEAGNMSNHPIISKMECVMASSSIMYQEGYTKLLISVFGPKEMKSFGKMDNKKATFDVEIRPSNIKINDSSENTDELLLYNDIILKCVKIFVNSNLYPKCNIKIIIDIIQYDGHAISTCINGCYCALQMSGIAFKQAGIALTVCKINNGLFHTLPFQLEKKCCGIIILVMDPWKKDSILFIETLKPIEIRSLKNNIPTFYHIISNMAQEIKKEIFESYEKYEF